MNTVINADLGDARRALSDLERAFEDAAAAGDHDAATEAGRQLAEARETVERLEAAERGQARAAEAAREAARERQHAARRARYYRWSAEYVRLVGPVIAAQEQLDAARRALVEHGMRPGWPGKPGAGPVPEAWEPLADKGARDSARVIPGGVERRFATGEAPVPDPTQTTRRGAASFSEQVFKLGSSSERFQVFAAQIDELAAAAEQAAREEA